MSQHKGMLWQDDAPKDATLEERIMRAVNYYRQKYGRLPKLVQVNPKTSLTAVKIKGITVEPVKTVMVGHFLVTDGGA